MRNALSLILAGLCAAAAIQPNEFVPTSEWQSVPEGVAIPGGLEIRLDMAEGGRWARIPAGGDSSRYETSGSEAELAIATLSLDDIDLNDLEEIAPGYDHGADIVRDYGAALSATFADSSDPRSDQAGRILGICLRNNEDAARNLAQACPGIAEDLDLSRRSLLITSALVSTQPGLSFAKDSNVLARIQSALSGPQARDVDASVASAVRKLLVNLVVAGEDGEPICHWAAVLQQAAYTSQQPELKQVALEIVERQGDFSGLTVKCKPQPGLLPVQEERKRAAATTARLANPKAQRNHFEEL